MKVSLYEQLVRAGATRRDVLKGAASMAAIAAASTGALGALTRQASAQDGLRAQILKIPGVGTGQPAVHLDPGVPHGRHRSAERC